MGTTNHDDPRLTLDSLPDQNEPATVFRFATTFDACQRHGSAAAWTSDRTCLNDLRIGLFKAARASHHSDPTSYVSRYQEVHPLFVRSLGS